MAEPQTHPVSSRPRLRPWYFVICFGLVSLFADMVYEGARSIIGPYLATLGASAAVVGAVAGIGEFIGYGLRVASGYLVQRRRQYWTWTITGYALTVLSVPLIGATGAIAAGFDASCDISPEPSRLKEVAVIPAMPASTSAAMI